MTVTKPSGGVRVEPAKGVEQIQAFAKEVIPSLENMSARARWEVRRHLSGPLYYGLLRPCVVAREWLLFANAGAVGLSVACRRCRARSPCP